MATTMNSLYETLTEAGIETANHETDLYFPATQKALEILDQFPQQKGIAERFTNDAPPNVGEQWIDVPFAYDPEWEKRLSKSR